MSVNQYSDKKALWISPLLGAFFSISVFFIYYIILLLYHSDTTSLLSPLFWLKSLGNFLLNIPLLLIAFSLISYFFTIPIGIALFKIKEKHFLQEGVFWFMAGLVGLFLGIVVGYSIYYHDKSIFKLIVVIFCFSFGALFNASLFSVLTGRIKNTYKYQESLAHDKNK